MSAKRPAGGASPDPREAARRYLPFLIIGGVLVFVVITAIVWVRLNDSSAQSGNTAATSAGVNASNASKGGNTAAPPPPPRRAPLPGASPAHAVGPETAPVVLEEFGDFQCPPCGRMHPVIEQLKKDYGGRLRFVFRHYPLQQIHKNAFTAARAAEAAGMQGKFWEMHDLIFDNQTQWAESPEPRPIFADYAKRLGLNVEKFRADSESPAAAERVMADYQRGTSMGVGGTPTFFVNGRELPGVQGLDPSYVRGQIEQALAGARPAQ
jgi:protein-disulfide isomerase